MEWISVEEQAPPESGTILTYDGNYISTGEYLYTDEKGTKYYMEGSVVFSITHWMPLPKAPMAYLEDDNPELWEKVKNHTINMPSDWEGEYPIFCNKCGKEAVMLINMLWVCPETADIPTKYFHPG